MHMNIFLLLNALSVPDNFNDVLKEHTMNGLRVLAMAWKPLAQNVAYEQVQGLER